MKKTFLKGLKTTFYSLGLLLLFFTVMFFTSHSVKAATSRQIDVTVGWDEGSVTTSTNPQNVAPTVSLSATPSSVDNNSSRLLTLNWSNTNVNSCRASFSTSPVGSSLDNGTWDGDKIPVLLGSDSITLSQNTSTIDVIYTFKLTCIGSDGSILPKDAIVTLHPNGTPPPGPSATVSLTAAPSTFVIGGPGQSTLTWKTANTSSCNASGSADWTGPKTSNSASILDNRTGPVTVDTSLAAIHTYKLDCIANDNITHVLGIATVTVNANSTSCTPLAPAVTLAAFPQTINSGASSTLYWNSSGADTCSIAGNGINKTDLSNTVGLTTGSLTNTGTSPKTYTYNLSCTKTTNPVTPPSTAIATVIVNPTHTPPTPTPTPTVTPTPVAACPASRPVTGCAGVWVADGSDGSGNKKCVPVGSYANVNQIGFNTNEISYIAVEPGYEADIYTGTGFTNSSSPLSIALGAISNTTPGILKAGANNMGDYTSPDGYADWNDSVQSMKVTQTSQCDLVTFYQNADLKGKRESFVPGDYPIADSGRVGGISSALISPGVSFEVFDTGSFWGNYHIEPAQPIEHSLNFVNFNDYVRSFKIRVGNVLN